MGTYGFSDPFGITYAREGPLPRPIILFMGTSLAALRAGEGRAVFISYVIYLQYQIYYIVAYLKTAPRPSGGLRCFM